MAFSKRTIPLPGLYPGVVHELTVFQFGASNTSRSIYLQAGLHADENPGLLVLQHLLERLKELDDRDGIDGLITIVPFANPIGMSQRVFDSVLGRFDLGNGENFNRNFPSFDALVSQQVSAEIERSAADWKACFVSHLDSLKPTTATATMKWHLTRLAIQHDIVLDLHCDIDCVSHLYASQAQEDQAVRLAGALKVPVVLLEPDGAGGQAFDNVYSSAWRQLELNGAIASGQRGFSATVELRGKADIDDPLAKADAAGLLEFMAQEGIVDGHAMDELDAQPRVARCYPLVAASHVPCPVAGLVVYRKRPGDAVDEGEVIAEVVHLDGIGERTPVRSDCAGMLVIRQAPGLVRPGQRLALIASHMRSPSWDGSQPLLDA
ncbi:ectoine utilization protein EutE [compost metagenome]